MSEIEAYLACPLRWLITYGIKARDVDYGLGAAELGSLAHGLLAEFYREWRRGARTRVTPATVDEALVVLGDAEEVVNARVRPRDLAERLAVAAVHKRAGALVHDDATFLPGFEPVEHEFAFGTAAGRPFEFGGVSLAGTIDRIDATPDALVVTDYKSGAAVAGHGRFAGDGLVQLPVYAAAAASMFERPAVGAVYRSLASLQVRGAWIAGRADLSARGVSTDSVDESSFASIASDAEERVAAAVRGMREGRIEPAPRGEKSCQYCAISATCEEAKSSWAPN